jgi:hypothetical protein
VHAWVEAASTPPRAGPRKAALVPGRRLRERFGLPVFAIVFPVLGGKLVLLSVKITELANALPRLHPGITQEVAPNDNQSGPKAGHVSRANFHPLFVACWLRWQFRKGS